MAVLGISFAVVLILMQVGFREALFDSAVRYHKRFIYDIALFSTDSSFIVRPESFSKRRLYQALGINGVESVSPVYIFPSNWKNPYNHRVRSALTVGVEPDHFVLDTPGVPENLELIRQQDVVLFDALSRPEHGPIAERFRAGETITTEVNDRKVSVVGLFEMGTSFGIDASLITSDTNFLRLFPSRDRNDIDLGLIRLEPGADPAQVAEAIRDLLPDDVLVLTKSEFIEREIAYWNGTTPIGYVFAFGAIVGFVVGAIIVYQILFADVSDHLAEYATLKAIGHTNLFVSAVVVQQAVALAILGYLPGLLVSLWLYDTAGEATRLPLLMTWERGIAVLLLTIAMGSISGLIALRKVRSVDPAEIF